MEDVIQNLELNANLTERRELDAFYAQYNVPTEMMYPNVFFTEEEIEEISILQTDIDSYVLQKYAQWIVDGGADAEWDAFQKQLKTMGVDRNLLWRGRVQKPSAHWQGSIPIPASILLEMPLAYCLKEFYETESYRHNGRSASL